MSLLPWLLPRAPGSTWWSSMIQRCRWPSKRLLLPGALQGEAGLGRLAGHKEALSQSLLLAFLNNFPDPCCKGSLCRALKTWHCSPGPVLCVLGICHLTAIPQPALLCEAFSLEEAPLPVPVHPQLCQFFVVFLPLMGGGAAVWEVCLCLTQRK